jgi:hypothetical protein
MDQEEIYWLQRGGANWLLRGDQNTSFFHNAATTRKIIKKLFDDTRMWHEAMDQLKIMLLVISLTCLRLRFLFQIMWFFPVLKYMSLMIWTKLSYHHIPRMRSIKHYLTLETLGAWAWRHACYFYIWFSSMLGEDLNEDGSFPKGGMTQSFLWPQRWKILTRLQCATWYTR